MGIGIGLGLGLGTPARCDRQEAARPGGQGGPASPEPAAVQKRITPARARGRLAARHSEALLRAAALERARLGDRLVQLLAEARTARQESRPPWRSTFIHSSLGRSRKVSSGSIVEGARKRARGVYATREPGAPCLPGPFVRARTLDLCVGFVRISGRHILSCPSPPRPQPGGGRRG